MKNFDEIFEAKSTALLMHLDNEDLTAEDISTDDNKFFRIDGEEYYVLDDDEAYSEALRQNKDVFESCYDEKGLWNWAEKWGFENIIDDTYVNDCKFDMLDDSIESIDDISDDDVYETIEMFGEITPEMCDFEKAAKFCIQSDGVGHLLASYDGNEYYENGYNIYRVN